MQQRSAEKPTPPKAPAAPQKGPAAPAKAGGAAKPPAAGAAKSSGTSPSGAPGAGAPKGGPSSPAPAKPPPKASVLPPKTREALAAAGLAAGPEDLKPVPLGRASDEELMRRTQNGDKQAFEILYERYHPSVLSYLYRMLGNLEDVESIGQEVFLRAFRFAPTYRYPQKFSTWLFTITRNLAINQSRRRKRSPIRNITELNLDGIDISGDPYQVAARSTDNLERQEEIAHVLKALDNLPTDQKEVIVLGVFQDLSYAEMEEITGTKAVTLRSRMFHGLKRLGRTLGGGGSEGET